MEKLAALVASYLESMGYVVRDRHADSIVAERSAVGSDKETIVSWVLSVEGDTRARRSRESRLLQEFAKTTLDYPRGRYFLVAESFEGLSADFRSTSYKLGVKFRVPVQFFDAPFRHEEAPDSFSAVRGLRDSALPPQARVNQPYRENDGQETGPQGDDLLTRLVDALRTRPAARSLPPHLYLVLGAAGAGKTILFKSLFARLYELFQEAKARQLSFPRPVPFVTDHLRNASALRTRAVAENLLRADVAVPMPYEALEWLLINGFTTWMFDGVDELYSGDPAFFEFILDLLTRPGSAAQIVLCARESLLTTSDALGQLLEAERPSPAGLVSLFTLCPWERQSKRLYAWTKTQQRRPRTGEVDPPVVKSFLDTVSQPGALQELSGLPYYCDLMLRQHLEGHSLVLASEVGLLENALSEIVKREISKGLITRDIFERDDTLDEWLETIGVEAFSNPDRGLRREDLAEYAEVALRPELTEEERRAAITRLVQFPVFAAGYRPGLVCFEHELLAEFLAAKHFLRRIVREPLWVGEKLGERPDLGHSLTLRCLAHGLPAAPGAVEAVTNALKSDEASGAAFRNLLQVIIAASPDSDVLKKASVQLEARDLSGIVFRGQDLQGLSLRSADLTRAEFIRCDLRGAYLEGAILSSTRFEDMGSQRLAGAKFGALERAESVFAGNQRLDERTSIANWVRRTTGVDQAIADPCAAAKQLRALFRKYVDADGQGRRDELVLNALTRGRRTPGGPSPEDCVDAAQRFEFLSHADQRGRIRRAQGDRYSEMVRFVRDWELSTAMRQMLSTLCSKRGCAHVPRASTT